VRENFHHHTIPQTSRIATGILKVTRGHVSPAGISIDIKAIVLIGRSNTPAKARRPSIPQRSELVSQKLLESRVALSCGKDLNPKINNGTANITPIARAPAIGNWGNLMDRHNDPTIIAIAE